MLVHVSITPKAIWYIESHLDDELSLDAIADAAGVSRFHLSRAFAASTGGSLDAARDALIQQLSTAGVAGELQYAGCNA